MDIPNISTIVVQAGAFIAAIAAVVGSTVLFRVTKKFGVGILASGFKNIATGVAFISLAIIIDAFLSYIAIASSQVSLWLIVIKEILLVVGTYIIVIGTKTTADKLENLTKQT